MQEEKTEIDKNPLLKGIFFSIGTKILVLTMGLVFITAATMGGMYYRQIVKITTDKELKELAMELDVMEPQFKHAFYEMKNDVLAISKMPPIQGLIRSKKNGGVDPLDGSTSEHWKMRLETIFSSLIVLKPHYVQMRYIGKADNGKELVRVSQYSGKIETTPEEQLRHKENQYYFKDAIKLDPEEIYFSVVSMSKDQGKKDGKFSPVIRAIVPIFNEDDKNGEIFGMIVINAAYDKLLEKELYALEKSKSLYVVNEEGDYFIYNSAGERSNFVYGGNYKNQGEEKTFLKEVTERPFRHETLFKKINGEEHALHYNKLSYSPTNKERFLDLILTVPKKVLLEDTHATRRKSLFITVSLFAISLILTVLLTNILKRPLNQMISEVRNYKEKGESLNLPINRRDEIGAFARAFQTLAEKLSNSIKTEQLALHRLQLILDNTADGLLTTDETGNIESFNKACEEIFGYTAQEVIGKNIAFLIPDPEDQEFGRSGGKSIGGTMELSGKRKNGENLFVDISVNSVNESERVFLNMVVRDISERKKAEDEILRSNEELERFAYIASHDLQEPLRMIFNFTELLSEEYGNEMDDQAKQYMKFVTDASFRMRNLVSDLLEYSRAGADDSGRSEFDVNIQIASALENLKEAIEETGTIATVGEMPVIYSNPVRFLRLIQNLVGNSIKYRAKDRTPNIEINAEETSKEWVFSVKDNGIGIKEDYKEQIFVIFKRLHSSNEYSGTGIGLAICKKIVDNFGGRIWVESEEGKGSCFYFTIPRKTIKESDNGY